MITDTKQSSKPGLVVCAVQFSLLCLNRAREREREASYFSASNTDEAWGGVCEEKSVLVVGAAAAVYIYVYMYVCVCVCV